MRTLFSAFVGGTIVRLIFVSALVPSVVSGLESHALRPSEQSSTAMASPQGGIGAPPGVLTIDAVQTDLFTGATTAQIPIVAPPGAGGVGPKIVLSYHSSTVDERKPRDQAQVAGLGWTLDVGGFIFRDLKNTTTTTDDTFKLVLGNASYDLVLIDSTHNIYHTKDETFLKIQYVPASDSWILTTKDGTQHRFGSTTNSKAITRGQDRTTAITYKYLLDLATTTSGVAVRYTYTKQTGTIASNGQTYDQAVSPATITYAYADTALIGSAREVLFTYAPRSDWTDTSASTVLSFFDKNRLDTIEVRVGGSLVRRYVFGFDYSIDRAPTSTWGGGGMGDLTLKTVTIYGADGTSSLPSPSFSYADARLSDLNNGIGGAVRFGYERVKATGAVYRAVSPTQSSEATSACDGGYSLSLAPDPTCGGTVVGYLVDSPVAGTSAALYRAVSPTQSSEATSACDGGSYLSLAPDPACGGTVVGFLYVASFDRHRVSTRSVSDGRGGASTLAFGYTGLGLSRDGKEFRGHASVRAVDTLGHYADTWFNQDDLLTGRPSRSQTRHSNGALLAETTNTWVTTTPYPGVTLVTLAQTDMATCDDTGAGCKVARVSLAYDAYGNPTRTYQWGDVALSGDERDEHTDWVVDTTTWLHRPKRAALYDAAGALLRERWLSYDGLGWGSLGSRGLLTREERRLTGPQGTTGNPVVASGYDSYGNRTTITDARGCTTTTAHEESRTYPATVTTCLGHTTTFAFDPRWGERTRETDPNNQTTTYAYDTFGRLTKATGPLDSGSHYGSMSRFYIDFGNTAAQRVLTYRTTVHGTASVIWTDEHFDGLGRTYLSRSQGPGGQTIQSETTYDARGLVLTQSAPHFATDAGVVTQFRYDARGRRTHTLHPDGTSVRTAYAPRLVTITDQRANVKRRFHDVYGRPSRVEEVNGGETYATTYAYDAAGALVRVTNHLGQVTTLTYDLVGRKTAMRDPNMGSWTYGYDLGGNLVSQTDAEHQTLTFTYDPQGRVLTKTYPDGAQVQWTHDDPAVIHSQGRLTKVADPVTVTTYAYDALGRVTRAQRLLDGATYTMSQSHNALGEVVSRTFPDGETVAYTFDEAGWLASIPGYITSIAYNARGQQTEIRYANGVTSTWNYHPTNFRVTNRSTTGASEVLQNLAYTYDPSGNVTRITDAVFTGGRTFTYDALNRLASASGTFGTDQAYVIEHYRYNAIGDILENAGVLYAYSDPLHPSAVTSRTDGSAYAYDANGNTLNGAGRALAWDADHRLSAVTIHGGNSATFAYDPAGLRIRKTTSAGVTRYPFAGYEIDPAGVVTKYLGGIAKKSTGEALFYHNDHLGGVNVVTDLSGARVQLVEYHPWGQVSRSEGNADPSHRFTGKELDPETGLYYYGGRYYDPSLARFVSADPFVPAPGNPQSLNRYSYVLNSPVNLVDPSGFFFQKLWRWIQKWARRNELLSAVIGVHLMALPSPAANLAGLSMVTATETGRTTLAASLVIGTAVATWYCGGCAVAAGSLVGELLGAYSAYQSGGDIVTGVVVGGIVGGATAYLGQYMATAVPDGGWALNVGRWAVEGGGQGIAVGFAGGRGDVQSIVLASAIASTAAIVLNSAYYGMVEYNATLQPGGEALRKDTNTIMPFKGANNVGEATVSPGTCPTCEGAPLSRALNRIPGINATAGFHDALLVKIELAGLSTTGRAMLNVPLMLPSAALTFGALVPGVPATAVVDR